MEVKHFSYFVTIVECGCNLSAAAKKIHISQSALSKIILSFEQEENVHLFYRDNGRLTKLTPAGEILYTASLDICGRYQWMLEQIRQEASDWRGKIHIGIPPLVLTVVFSSFISDFSLQYPNIQLDILEAGAEELTRKFRNHEIDFPVLLTPSNLSDAISREYALYQDVLTAFMSKTNALAGKQSLQWSDLDQRQIAIFNETFTIHRLLMDKFKAEKIKPNIAWKSASWDFMLESAQNSDLVTFLPSPIKNYAVNKNFVEIPFDDPIVWEVVLVEPTDKKQTPAHNKFKQFALDYFQGEGQAVSAKAR